MLQTFHLNLEKVRNLSEVYIFFNAVISQICIMKKAVIAGVTGTIALSTGFYLYHTMGKKERMVDMDFDITKFHFREPNEITELDRKIVELARDYAPQAIELIHDLIKIPADHYEEDPLCGTTNHETSRLEYLKQYIIDKRAVDNAEDVFYDEFGNLVWTIRDSEDTTPLDDLKVIYFDGHSDTVKPFPDNWHSVLGEGIDPFNGLTDITKVNEENMRKELKYLPPKDKWDHLLFGCGSVDQIQGLVSQVFATKILLETCNLGSLRGIKIVSIATVAEEENVGGGPMYYLRHQSGLQPNQIPDCVVLTNATGDIDLGPCGIYIGHRGQCQIEVEVIGHSCNGAIPNVGVNPLEYGSLIIAEASQQARNGFGENKFLGKGTRTATKCCVESPSICSVPSKFTFRLDRRLTLEETADQAIKELNELTSVQRARKAGCIVNIKIPNYTQKTHKGVAPNNEENYNTWLTHPSDPVVRSAVDTYKRVVSPNVDDLPISPENIPKKPRIHKWACATDGVGYIFKNKDLKFSVENKNWCKTQTFTYPPMFGIGAGFEQHSHKLGEYIHKDHIWAPIAVIARFPSVFLQKRHEADQK